MATVSDSDCDSQLRRLFTACDTDGSGFIGVEEVRDICSKFGIPEVDGDAIFEDLDRDGDGKVSFEDFHAGFDEYEKSILTCTLPLSPGFQLIRTAGSIDNIKKALEQEAKDRNGEKMRNEQLKELPLQPAPRYCNQQSELVSNLIDLHRTLFSNLNQTGASELASMCSCS